MLVTTLAVLASAATVAIQCPHTLPAAKLQPLPFELIGEPPVMRAQAALAGVSLYSGLPGEEQKVAPVSLVPDVVEHQGPLVRSVWELQGQPNERFLLVCRYRGSSSYLRVPLPAAVLQCVLSDRQGTKALSCR